MMTLFHSIHTWLRDPFGKHRKVSRHTEMITQMHETKAVTQRINKRIHESYCPPQRFPVGHMIGHPQTYPRTQGKERTHVSNKPE